MQDLKSAIDDQTRNYRDLQVCFSKKFDNFIIQWDIFSKPQNLMFANTQAASEKVLTDNRDFKSMQVMNA